MLLLRLLPLLSLNNPMSCAGNNYKHILSKYQNVLNNPTCVYDHFYSMCDDNMDITVLRDMIDVRDGFKTCAYYTHNDVEDVINDIYLNRNVKLTFFFLIVPLFLLQCVNKDIIIILIKKIIFLNTCPLQECEKIKPFECFSMTFVNTLAPFKVTTQYIPGSLEMVTLSISRQFIIKEE